MDQLRRLLTGINRNLGKLTVTHKLLIASLLVVSLMTLFVVSQYAGSAKMVEVLPGASADAVSKAQAYLDSAGLPYKAKDGKLLVPAERQVYIMSALGEAGKLPADASLTFKNYIDKQNWMNPKSENDRIFNTALENTLALVIKNFKGIESATVLIDAPEPRGIGSTFRKPVASVIVFTKGGTTLSAGTVAAIASTVASAKAGLEANSVNISDGTSGRKYTVQDAEDFAASTYMEHAAKYEQYVQEKIVGHLAYIRGVSVAVNAQVDVRRTTSRNRTVKPKGAGSETLISKESTTNSNQTDPKGGGGEAGIGANVRMDIKGASGGSTTSETGDTGFTTMFGTTEDQVIDPHGMPTKINATIGVPRDYVVKLWEQAQGSAGAATPPTDADLKPVFDAERQRIEKDIAPLIETDARVGASAAEPLKAGTVVVSMIPFAMGGAGGSGGSDAASGAGMLGGVGSMASSGLIKQVALGGLALVAMGMMLLMVRKTSKAVDIPTAEELVGLPPALVSGSDLVGEAEEGDTAMEGIEMDEGELNIKRMLDEVGDLVKDKPTDAASLFKRWVQPED